MCERVDEFLNYMKDIKGKSLTTVEAYKVDLNMFINFMMNKKQLKKIDDEELNNIELSDLHSFMSYVKNERNNSANTMARKCATIKSFFKYLKMMKLIDENIAEYLETTKIPKKQPSYLTDEDVDKILNNTCLEYEVNGIRDFAILNIFLYCGIRCSELSNLKLSNIKGNQIRIEGKGNKERFVYMPDKVLQALNKWLEVRKTKNIKEEYQDIVFISKKGNKMHKNTIGKMVKNKGKEVGLNIHPHLLRRTLSTNMLHNNVPLPVISRILGHSDVGVTSRYLGTSDDDLKKAFDTVNY